MRLEPPGVWRDSYDGSMHDDMLTNEEIQRAVQQVFKLAQTDLEFRALCLADPAEAIRQITGKSLPPGVDIQFREPGPEGTA